MISTDASPKYCRTSSWRVSLSSCREGRAFVGDAALQGALAHAQFLGDHDEVGPTTGQQALQYPLHLFENGLFRSPCLELILELGRVWRKNAPGRRRAE